MNKVVFLYLNQIQRYDQDTYFHSCRVSNISYFIGRQLGLSVNELNILKNAAYLHDLGKLKVSRKVLNKKESLTPDEWLQIKSHPIVGYRLLKRTKKPICQISDAIISHHERYSGDGYPKSIKGEDIPFLGRIIALADGLDAMATIRPYRSSMSLVDACKEIKECSGIQFDPYVVNALLKTNIEDLAFGIYKFQQLAKA